MQIVENSSTRTVPIKLDVDESAADLLHQTNDHFLNATNPLRKRSVGIRMEITSKQKLHHLTYYNV